MTFILSIYATGKASGLEVKEKNPAISPTTTFDDKRKMEDGRQMAEERTKNIEHRMQNAERKIEGKFRN
jgi:hypothetical protein